MLNSKILLTILALFCINNALNLKDNMSILEQDPYCSNNIDFSAKKVFSLPKTDKESSPILELKNADIADICSELQISCFDNKNLYYLQANLDTNYRWIAFDKAIKDFSSFIKDLDKTKHKYKSNFKVTERCYPKSYEQFAKNKNLTSVVELLLENVTMAKELAILMGNPVCTVANPLFYNAFEAAYFDPNDVLQFFDTKSLLISMSLNLTIIMIRKLFIQINVLLRKQVCIETNNAELKTGLIRKYLRLTNETKILKDCMKNIRDNRQITQHCGPYIRYALEHKYVILQNSFIKEIRSYLFSDIPEHFKHLSAKEFTYHVFTMITNEEIISDSYFNKIYHDDFTVKGRDYFEEDQYGRPVMLDNSINKNTEVTDNLILV